MIIAAVLIGFVLHRFVQGQIDQRLDTQIVFSRRCSASTAMGGSASPATPTDRRSNGCGTAGTRQVTGPNNTLRSALLDGADLDNPVLRDIDRRRPPPPPPPPRKDRDPAGGSAAARGRDRPGRRSSALPAQGDESRNHSTSW